jgi:dTDP-4-dehydrorhamnose 3,5-epimerase
MTAFRSLAIPEVIEVTPLRFGDHRGYFTEAYNRSAFEAAGIAIDWVQDNQSFSAQAGTMRGLHLQLDPHAQHKLVRVLRGAIFDVAVDVRRGSPTHGKWVGAELSAEKGNQLLVPIGFAHGFITLVPDTEVLYKVSSPWMRESERAIRWDDPAIGIDWPRLDVAPTLLDRDREAPLLADAGPLFG